MAENSFLKLFKQSLKKMCDLGLYLNAEPTLETSAASGFKIASEIIIDRH